MRALVLLLVVLDLVASSAARALPRVVAVHPSGPEVPENLLRLSVTLDAPTAEPLLPVLALRRADGSPLEAPFLEQELWSPDGRTLTLLLHPGRVKTGLIANVRLGRPLPLGEDVELTLAGRTVRRWRVRPADEQPPEPQRWRVRAPSPGTRESLEVTLEAPVEAQAVNLIALADGEGHRVEGSARLENGERLWRFTPARPWRVGHYRLVVNDQLEDAAGNRVGQRFEHVLGEAAPAAEPLPDFTLGARGPRQPSPGAPLGT